MGRCKIDWNKVKELHAKGLNDGEIARILNCSRSAIKHIRNRLGLKANCKPFHIITDEEKKIIRDLNEAGFNDREIAAILGVSYTTVRRHRKRMGLPSVGHTCCSLASRVKAEHKKKKVEMCAKATMEFLDSYFGRSNVG